MPSGTLPSSGPVVSSSREIPFWELTFTSRSFLYKQVGPQLIVAAPPAGSRWKFLERKCSFMLQVRRMAGALVAVGRGRLSARQLQELLEARDSLAYPQGIAAPAHGLFLTRVHYEDSGQSAATHRSPDNEPL